MFNVKIIVIVLLYVILFAGLFKCVTSYNVYDETEKENEEKWNGHWFPFSPDHEADPNAEYNTAHINDLSDSHHGVAMGVVDPDCDDGKKNLKIDWNLNPFNYTCFQDKRQFWTRSELRAIYSADHIPPSYSAPHYCMRHKIDYDDIIPTYGPHRPLWAKYGEYEFLPKQRWVHNLEHGAIVMLYHPCANKNEVNLLRKLTRSCLYRHVITPYNLLTEERPLALVAWGHRLEMSKVAPDMVFNFIRNHALKGPEQTWRDGQYSQMLKKHAEIVSDINDSNICDQFQLKFTE